jgi:Protein of unknown function DUF2617
MVEVAREIPCPPPVKSRVSSRKSMDAMPTNNRTKQRRSGGLTLLLYQRTLHPEFFKILEGEQVSRRAYEADIWLVEGGHVITFTAGKTTLSEVIVTNNDTLNDRNLLQSIQCRGEKYHEMTVGGNVRYMISTQEEQLTQTLYDATKHEISSYASKRELMTAEMPPAGDTAGSLHVLDIERQSNELIVHSFHLFDENQMVIKTQAIIEAVKGL